VQKRHGYRFSLDAVLLAGLSSLRPAEQVLDLGTGCGIIPLLLAGRYPDCRFVGVEYQGSLALLAETNVRLNGLETRISLLQTDMQALPAHFPAAAFSVVLSNPPYRPLNSGRLNPDSQRALARHEIAASLQSVAHIAAYLLPPGGRLYLIYPAWRLVTLLSVLRQEGLEPKQLRLIYSRSDDQAVLAWLEARRGSGEELHVLPPLTIYRSDGRYSPEMAGLLS